MRNAFLLLVTLSFISAFTCDAPQRDHNDRPDDDPGSECTGQIPVGQTLSEACCPGHGRDACGALLFCGAFDGRDEYTCYPERSRPDLTDCEEDFACVSGECSLESGLCRSSLGSICTAETGCATAPSGHPAVCDVAQEPFICALRGDGSAGSVCGVDEHCDSNSCVDARCVAAPGETCFSSAECPGESTCRSCDTCEDASPRCVSTCNALECTLNDPGEYPCYVSERSGIAAPCPPDAPANLTCTATSFRADHGAFEVQVSWQGASDGYEVRCERDDGASFILAADGATSVEMNIEPTSAGTSHICAVRFLTRTNHAYYGWLFGPTASCSVIAP